MQQKPIQIHIYVKVYILPVAVHLRAELETFLFHENLSLFWKKSLLLLGAGYGTLYSRINIVLRSLIFDFLGLICCSLKVRQSRNVFFKPTILPKNERMILSFLPNSTTYDQIVFSIFRKNSRIAKSPFEINFRAGVHNYSKCDFINRNTLTQLWNA